MQGAGGRNLGLVANVALGVAGAVPGGMLVSPGDFANAALTVDNFAMALVGSAAVVVIANTLRNHALR